MAEGLKRDYVSQPTGFAYEPIGSAYPLPRYRVIGKRPSRMQKVRIISREEAQKSLEKYLRLPKRD